MRLLCHARYCLSVWNIIYLVACCAVCGTVLVYATLLRACYAMNGATLAYGTAAYGCTMPYPVLPSLGYRICLRTLAVLSACLPTSALRNVQYSIARGRYQEPLEVSLMSAETGDTVFFRRLDPGTVQHQLRYRPTLSTPLLPYS